MSSRPIRRREPKEYTWRHLEWRFWWFFSNSFHMILGGVAVTFATMGAIAPEEYNRWFSGIAGIFTAWMGFFKPKKHFMMFSKAWCVLDQAIIRYRNGLIDLTELDKALEEGENIIRKGNEDMIENP